jgi:hypothetical protein
MATKITGYRIFTSTGGNTCVQCKVRMRKGLPYLSPITGKRVIRELKGKSVCIACVQELADSATTMLSQCDERDVDKYQAKRFLEHLDKEENNG